MCLIFTYNFCNNSYRYDTSMPSFPLNVFESRRICDQHRCLISNTLYAAYFSYIVTFLHNGKCSVITATTLPHAVCRYMAFLQSQPIYINCDHVFVSMFHHNGRCFTISFLNVWISYSDLSIRSIILLSAFQSISY